ncbi:T9SS type A sorting domain-containing protein [Adhaeribacter soli]|uniref:T9SS type A sorting domain-containing protein n=2 Tax=Adhaeribacter soli TaxID=2607655 RepID=A0A5N1J2F9_9BACT|nr:T9SS type A sorting domain-containing protein [Adhaeribacter soli]
MLFLLHAVKKQQRILIALLFLNLLLIIDALAQSCAYPGKDGVLSGSVQYVNTYYPANVSVTPGTNKSITLGAARTVTGITFAPISIGDLVLIIQMQGAEINSENTDAYGDGVAGSDGKGYLISNLAAGRYEYAVATNSVPLAGGNLTVASLSNSYTNANYGSQGQRRYQVIRIPQYSSATLGATVTCPAWDGATGGVVGIDVAGTLNFNSRTIDVSGMGFRGGAGRSLAGGTGSNSGYRSLSTVNNNAQKGEGIAGTPAYVYTNGSTSPTNTSSEGYPNGSSGRGAPGNAGGGGNDGTPATNEENSGGGGGGNGGAGGIGGNTWRSNLPLGGFGGTLFTFIPTGFETEASRMILGGGGGAGTTNNGTGGLANGLSSSGAAGGGIVMIRAGRITGTGTINANGSNANTSVVNDGSGGGGAGGSVLLTSAETSNLNRLRTITVNARGGNGGNNTVANDPHGPGGGGGGGVILTNGNLAASSVTNGLAGTTGGTITFGATNGSPGIINQNISNVIPNSTSGTACKPVLSVIKTTSTANVIRNPVNGTATATYTITLSNSGGAAQGVTISDLLPAGFNFNSNVSVNLTGGSFADNGGNATTGVVSAAGSSSSSAVGATTLIWNYFSIPTGGSVAITFMVNIAPNVSAKTYQNSATVTYLDPTRSAATRKITPLVGNDGATSTIYQTGITETVPGANYEGVAFNGEDVNVPNNVPVANNVTAASVRQGTIAAPISALNATDFDGTIVSYTLTTLPNAAQGVLFVNGVPALTGMQLTLLQAAQLTFTPAATFSGNASFTFTATDNNGAIDATPATYSVPVVTNMAPIANNITSDKITRNTTTTQSAIYPFQAIDLDGSVVSFTILTLPSAGTLYVNNVAASANQVVTLAQASQLTYDPTNNANGYPFTYRATDNDGALSNIATYTLMVVNNNASAADRAPSADNILNAPIANSDGATSIKPLKGSGNLTNYRFASLPQTTQGQLRVNNGNPAVNTNYTVAQGGQLTFNPNTTYSGLSTFTYQSRNAQGNSANTATYYIPVSYKPVADAITFDSLANTVTTPTALSPLTALDPDGSVVSYTIETLPSTSEGVLFANGTPLTAAPVTLSPASATQLSFKPNASYSGTSVFNYTATDNLGLKATPVTYSVPVGNKVSSTPLPVELLSFTAKNATPGALLEWITATEKNNSHFLIEKSFNGKIFSVIGKVNGQGNTSSQQNYSFHDTEEINGLVYYRLKQVDYDGTYEFSKIVVLQAYKSGKTTQVLLYPNPAAEDCTLLITGDITETATLSLYDVVGNIIWQKNVNITVGQTKLPVNVSSLAKGVYLVNITGRTIQATLKLKKLAE